MKKIFLVMILLYASVSFANCPSGYEAYEDPDYAVVADNQSCPSGYEDAGKVDGIVPFYGVCENNSIGTCGTASVCNP